MFSTGLKLMFMGMLMVFLYLVIMVIFIRLIEFLLRAYTQNEELRFKDQQKSSSNQKPDHVPVPVVVLTAAVAAYEADRNILYTS